MVETFLEGTLDMLIFRTLVTGPANGHTIAEVIEHTSGSALEVEQGRFILCSTVLKTMVWFLPRWGLSENNRKAKFYPLTSEGRKELSTAAGRWRRMTRAIGLILGESFE